MLHPQLQKILKTHRYNPPSVKKIPHDHPAVRRVKKPHEGIVKKS